MIFAKPKPIVSEEKDTKALYDSGERIAIASTERRVFEALALEIDNQAQLNTVLGQIQDEKQREIVLQKLIPLLRFTPEVPEEESEGDLIGTPYNYGAD